MTNNSFSSIGPQPSVAETVAMFSKMETALGWALDALDNGLLMPDEHVSFCRDLIAFHDPYARSVSLTAWVEEVATRRELARSFPDAA